MANVAKVLKAEISKIGRKEAKSAISPIARSNIALKKVVADLRGRVTALEKENRRLFAGVKREKPVALEKPSKETKTRITSTTIRSLRNRLGLSQAEFGKLAGVTAGAVYLWENKEGPLNLRDKTKAALLSIKGMGAREAKENLGQAGSRRKEGKAATS